MSTQKQTVFVTFGPVQEFLAEARRTRDLWAGSYLLSYLAASALVAAEKAGGTVTLPYVKDNPIVNALRSGERPASPGDRIGSIPHIAEVEPTAAGDPRTVAMAGAKGWDVAWKRVADTVHARVQGIGLKWTPVTTAIWNRQVDHLWTKAWVVGDAKFSAQRKTLRAFDLPPEPGEKCTCCGVRQALTSGADDRLAAVRAFWSGVDEPLRRVEIRSGGAERLCAICAIKRFYPHVAEKAIGWPVGVSLGFPSTITLAGIPWRLQVLRCGKQSKEIRDAVNAYVTALEWAEVDASRKPLARFRGLSDAAQTWPEPARDVAERLLSYDSEWFYPEELRDAERTSIPNDADETRRRALQAALSELLRYTRAAGISDAGTAYALVAMDGDNMGVTLQHYAAAGNMDQFSKALDEFSRTVIALVEAPEALGRVIYAGGDDVLALLPVTTALDVAERIRIAYREQLEAQLPTVSGARRPSISAGVVFAHAHAPLQEVVRSAHRILEQEAKERAGRDALAVTLWQRAGIAAQFAAKWQPETNQHALVTDLTALRDGIARDEYTRGFLYNAIDLLGRMDPSGGAVTLTPTQQVKLLAAEYLKSRVHGTDASDAADGAEQRVRAPAEKRTQAEARVGLLQRLVEPVHPGPRGRRTDAIRLLVFLGEGGA